MLAVANIAAAAVTAVLAVSSGRNMFQTWSLSRHYRNQVTLMDDPQCMASLLDPSDSTDTAITKMQAMKRKDLLQLYFLSRGPKDVSELQGEWNGSLLDNHSWVLTAVTGLLTDRLFGMGRRWNGKQFGEANAPQEGINRFHPRNSSQHQRQQQSTHTETEHVFQMSIRPSKLGAPEQTSLVLDYKKYQFPLSLWYTMMDEIRIVPLEGEARVLIGLGYMAWSGGRWNASPFLLYRNDHVAEENDDDDTEMKQQ